MEDKCVRLASSASSWARRQTTRIRIESVVPTGSGKSSFARRLFKPTEVLSSDYCRGLVSDDENDQAATGDVFDVLHCIARKRLATGKLAVVDATNSRPE